MWGDDSNRRGGEEKIAGWNGSLDATNYYLGLLDALGLMGLPGMVISASGRKLASNKQFQTLWATARGPEAGFSFAHAESDAKLAEALHKVAAPKNFEWPIAIPVHNRKHNVPLAIYVWAVCCPGHREHVALLSAHQFGRKRGPAEALLRALFNLTPAEAKVARAIADGDSISTIAENSAVSRETVRTQLASVLSKTGTCRQTDLALRIANLSVA